MTSRLVTSVEEKGKGKRPFVSLGHGGLGGPGSSDTCYNYGQLGIWLGIILDPEEDIVGTNGEATCKDVVSFS